MLYLRLIFFSLFLLICSNAHNQTLGTVYFDYSQTFDGFLLYSPSGNTDSYLIDNCGRKVNEWNGVLTNGTSSYLDTNGNLIKTINDGNNQTIDGGGAFDRIVKQDWNGNIQWNYSYGDADSRPHHDFIPLPNGNVIILVWERKSLAICELNGRDISNMNDTVIWSEVLIEIEPTGLNTGNIIWRWDIFDHLVQDFDGSKANFGIISDHPELMDINVLGTGNNAGNDDWLHANSIQYINEFDQIVISLRKINEAIVIDHSTTLAESESHSGGSYGKGGDILYRIGNPLNYQLGSASDKLLFRQHDCIIFPSNGNYYMSIFNNGNDRSTQYSSVDLIELPMNSDGSYIYNSGNIFAPSSYSYSYSASNPTDFYANRTSGAQVLDNGNIIICHGPDGHFFEIDTATNTTVWEYFNPVDPNGSNNDGADPNTLQNNVFKVRKYTESFQGFIGKDMTPGDYVELNSLNSCNLNLSQSTELNFSIYPNPAENEIRVSGLLGKLNYQIVDFSGRIIQNGTCLDSKINIENLNKGMYILRINNSSQRILKF
jgi:hypothetical protein